MLKGVPLPICWIHEWLERPGRRRQPGPKRGPVLAAATCYNARWAGMWSLSLTTWPNNELRNVLTRLKVKGNVKRAPQERIGGAHLTLPGLELVGGENH